ncbi:hypothetical protein NDU88_000386 [Pleurodeles waltl]|uniref:Uncharacterized protein n=1 Tax=Pleurodeles waltl TaxID=8319 RepID=A0AAV7U473_PLEWA|nr:hypothetical protein NDU88_000386 [Pleurodeles waltl]
MQDGGIHCCATSLPVKCVGLERGTDDKHPPWQLPGGVGELKKLLKPVIPDGAVDLVEVHMACCLDRGSQSTEVIGAVAWISCLGQPALLRNCCSDRVLLRGQHRLGPEVLLAELQEQGRYCAAMALCPDPGGLLGE